MSLKIITSFFLLMLCSCSATGPIFDGFHVSSNGESELIIYRPSFARAGGIVLDCRIDRTVSVSLKNAGYLRYKLAPGQHSVVISAVFGGSKESKSFTFEENKTHVLRVSPSTVDSYGAISGWALDEMNPNDAMYELGALRLSN